MVEAEDIDHPAGRWLLEIKRMKKVYSLSQSYPEEEIERSWEPRISIRNMAENEGMDEFSVGAQRRRARSKPYSVTNSRIDWR